MVQAEILIGCFVECQSIKKVAGRRSVEEMYQALFSFRPSRLNVLPSETKIEPDRRLGFESCTRRNFFSRFLFATASITAMIFFAFNSLSGSSNTAEDELARQRRNLDAS